MWYRFNRTDLDKSLVFCYKKNFKDRVLTITFDNGPRYKIIAFRGVSYIDNVVQSFSDEDVAIYGNPYYMSLKCVFETKSGIIGTEKIL